MKTIEFNDGELQALMQLIDIAVKSGGLNVAQAATVLAQKIGGAAETGGDGAFTEITEPQFAEVEGSIEPPAEEKE